MQEKMAYKKIERIDTERFTYSQGAEAARMSIELGKMAMRFSSVERIPRYEQSERENDAEHSFMLALVAPEIAASLEMPLDLGLVSQFAIVHDLIELKTNDVATFLFNDNDQRQKELVEQCALEELLHELPSHTATMLARYESQAEPETRFVRYIDKLLPIVIDIVGAGKQVMREDYHVTDRATLQQCHTALHERLVAKFSNEFPALDVAHALLCELFQSTYSV